MRKFISIFASDLDGMLSYREALGFSRRSHEPALFNFDSYVATNYPEIEFLCREAVVGWVDLQLAKSRSGNIAIKATAIRMFGKYLSALGKEAYILPDEYVAAPNTSFTPYLFTDEEMTRLFHTIDRIPQQGAVHALYTKIPPVLFRLIYTCGLRPNEGRELFRDSIDFNTGEILVTRTKRKKDRLVVMSDDMLGLCRKYDCAREQAGIESDYFFPRHDGLAYTSPQIERIFKNCWQDANPDVPANKLPSVRIYDLRHLFASTVLNNWLDEEQNLYNKLPYLRAYMGHDNISETVHYIHILPEKIRKSAGIDWETFESLIPGIR